MQFSQALHGVVNAIIGAWDPDWDARPSAVCIQENLLGACGEPSQPALLGYVGVWAPVYVLLLPPPPPPPEVAGRQPSPGVATPRVSSPSSLEAVTAL